MRFPLFIVKKYIKTKKDSGFVSLISVISITGITLGVAVLILALTILDGFENTIEKTISNFNSHIYISAFGDKNLDANEEIYNEINSKLGDNVKSIVPFISKNVIIKSPNLTDGIKLTALKNYDDNNINQFITNGNFDLESSQSSIIIGKKLAEKLKVTIGGKVTIFAIKDNEMPSFANLPNIAQFSVSGIFESGMAAYDDLNVFINYDSANALFKMDQQISGYNIRLNNIANLSRISKELQDELPHPYYVRSLYNLYQHIFTWLDLQKEPIPIILGLITLVAVFNIIGTLLMIVLEKTEAIGILKSLGANRKNLISIFVLQGIFLSVTGIVIGNILAFLISIIQLEFQIISLPSSIYFVSSVPVKINFFNYLIVSATAFVLSILAALIPSYIASKFNPITSIKFN